MVGMMPLFRDKAPSADRVLVDQVLRTAAERQ
jgi:hypothetical protein